MARRRDFDDGGGGPRGRDPNLQPLIDALLAGFRRLGPGAQLAVILLLAVVGVVALVLYYRAHRPTQVSTGTTPVHMLLGNPSGATPDSSNHDNYLMVKPYFALSYSASRGTPNWVSWQVTAADLGTAPRKQVFDPDTTLPAGFYQVTHRDYSGSGFDRGHMCPHSDRAANEQMSFATFVMTNIIPQAPNVNRKAWEQLESYARDLVTRQHQHLYVTAGPAGTGGRGSNGPSETIAKGRVTVPAECWKIIVAVPDSGGDDDLAKVSMGTRVIAVVMPNDDDAVGEEWAGFRTSVADVERRTGYHFFDRVRPDIAAALKQRVDNESIPPPRPRHYDSD